jgi:aryl-alcohol dehydrogenase-like predicted oxidoreductase
MKSRTLGRSGIPVSPLGLGTARIGGLGWRRTYPTAHDPAAVDAAIRALRRAVDLGVTFFDTADEYGCGYSERLLGRALRGRRQQVVISTKFGYTFDEQRCEVTGTDASPAYIRSACEASLRRLATDYIDLYLFHLRDYDLARAEEVRATLEDLVAEGKIRAYGWSTDDVARARCFAQGPHCTAVMHRLNIMMDSPEMLALCEAHDLASVNRVPLAMGVLSGTLTARSHLPEGDWRREFFKVDKFREDLKKVQAMRDILTRNGHTYVQAALGWIWARSERTVPVPGFRTLDHVEENAAAPQLGPLTDAQMQEIAALLGRSRA